MNRKLQVLRAIASDSKISQRQLAQLTDVSLGTINGLMQHLDAEGLIETQPLNGKAIAYHLTETGYRTKAELSRSEAIHCYRFIGEMKLLIKARIKDQIEDGKRHFICLGDEDEIFMLLKMALHDLKRYHAISFERMDAKDWNQCQESLLQHKQGQVLVWQDTVLSEKEVCHILLKS